MNLEQLKKTLEYASIPRVSGGEPSSGSGILAVNKYSPRERG